MLRFHPSLKCEETWPDEHEDSVETRIPIAGYRPDYHRRRGHEALDHRAPASRLYEPVSEEAGNRDTRSALVPGTVSLW